MMKKILFILLSIVLFSGCTEDFAEINTNPTATAEVPTSTLLTGAIQDLISLNAGLGYNKTCNFYVQHWTQRETTGRCRYGDINRDWGTWYLNGMPELYNIIELNSGDNKDNFTAYGSNNNQIAVAKILRAWAFQNITDAWGDVPYSEVGNPDISFPKYDSQESIYTGLLAELSEARGLIDESAAGVEGDLVYGGDMAKWKKLASSLRARVALRMSKANPSLGTSELTKALAEGVIASNADNALVDFQVEENYANPLFIEFKVQQWTFVSDILVNAMSTNPDFVDPRLQIYADTAKNTEGLIVGLEYGLTDGASTAVPLNDSSYPGELVRSTTFPSILFTYSEMKFIEAEAAKLGWISNDAEAAYNEAILGSMEFWGVDGAIATDYLLEDHVAFSDDNWEELIGTQKWLAFYTQGAQAWAEYRRIGYPILAAPLVDLQNDATAVPRRFFYDLAERNTNEANLDAAVDAMGGDNFDIRVWWDK